MKAKIVRSRCDCPMCESDPWVARITPTRYPGVPRQVEYFPSHAQALRWALEMLSTVKESA